ncbi:ABC transporter permease [Clostridium sp. BJN0013]|uniref:ABC transporter permease n=1 Tax=Clostridium sp. BJN0013 TaxID=3236840 RepID=UPI0034C6B4C2
MQRKPESLNNISGSSILYLLLTAVAWENFLFAIVAAIFVCRDFENETINMTFTYGYSKIKVLLSKFLVYLVGSAAILYIFIFSSTIIFSILYGFEKDLNIYFILTILKSILVNMLGITAISSITFLISILTRNSVLTIISPFFILFVAICISNFNNPIISNLLPFNLVINAIINHVKFIDLFKLLILCLLTIIFCIYVSNLHLKRIEFK